MDFVKLSKKITQNYLRKLIKYVLCLTDFSYTLTKTCSVSTDWRHTINNKQNVLKGFFNCKTMGLIFVNKIYAYFIKLYYQS